MIHDDELTEALTILQGIREFDWLTKSDQLWYSITDVSHASGVGKDSVRKWCENGEFPDAMNYQPVQIGWRIPRSNLMVFFAAMRRKNTERHDVQSA